MLSYIYLWFLPLVPLAVTAWLVWSRNLSYGYWFVTGQVLAWTLGTLSYYLLPTLGPGFYVAWVYEDVDRRRNADVAADGLAVGRARPGGPGRASRGRCSRPPGSPACTSRSRCWSR